MIRTERLTPARAETQVRQGSDIVVIPYASYMETPEPEPAIRLTIYTEMTALAAAELYHDAHTDHTKIVAVGEHTYGAGNVSTTELMYDYLAKQGVPDAAFPEEHPLHANATPQQIAWLARTFGRQWKHRPPVLVGHEQHMKRIAYLCELYRLPAELVDAGAILESTGRMTAEYAAAVRLYNEQNEQYEELAGRLTRAIAWLGPPVTTLAFRFFTHMRTPNVVDVAYEGRTPRLYAHPVRRHRRHLRSGRM